VVKRLVSARSRFLTTDSLIALVTTVVAVASFGAVLGGLAGARFHRRADLATGR